MKREPHDVVGCISDALGLPQPSAAELQEEVSRLRTGLRVALEVMVENQLEWEVGQDRHTDGEPHHCPDPTCDEYIGPFADPEHVEGCRYVMLGGMLGGEVGDG